MADELVIVEHATGWVVPMLLGGIQREGTA